MTELGRIEDLPADYRAALAQHHLVPLWPSLRALMPAAQPRPATQAMHWPYAALRPLLLQAGALTPIDKAERRVLVLANPGHGPESMQASAAIYLGMQLLMPGERAPSHRHTPNAVRMVVEGEGAWTTVAGQKCPMERGDLILTPTGLWHEHGHDGTEPVVWLDVLDLPLMVHLQTSYHVDGPREPGAQAGRAGLGDHRGAVDEDRAGKRAKSVTENVDAPASDDAASAAMAAAERACASAGVVPMAVVQSSRQNYPVLRYPWARVRAALQALAARAPAGAVQVAYVNPETGADALNVLGFSALMLRPGQTLQWPARSPACVMHLIEGAGVEVHVAALLPRTFLLAAADTCCAPGYAAVRLRNLASDQPAYLFIADDAPLHRKLGVFEVRT